MGLLDVFKKSSGPYKNEAINKIYNLLFCDKLDLYKQNLQKPIIYPWDILLADSSSSDDLQTIINDSSTESRMKVLVYNKLMASGNKIDKKDLLAVIVEVGLDSGLDVIASFKDGTARYINYTGSMIVWETTDEKSNALTAELFRNSENIVAKIGPWDKPRRPAPTKGNVRITFLVSDGLYFGEGPMNVLFNDPLASPALTSAAMLMKYLTEKALQPK
ncbi:MAG TPA: hypothetical protein VE978_22675 [Chitinophagales bacterium]|nr:hypothetical protein [Chitinophagales bacterium]